MIRRESCGFFISIVSALPHLLGEDKCHEDLGQMLWRDGRRCPGYNSNRAIKRGRNDRQPARQRYLCRNFGERFDDLTGTVFAGRCSPLSVRLAFLVPDGPERGRWPEDGGPAPCRGPSGVGPRCAFRGEWNAALTPELYFVSLSEQMDLATISHGYAAHRV
jgi:hypothetical protein